MVRDQGIEGCDQNQDKRPDLMSAQCGDEEGNTARQQAHLKKCIEGYGNHHIFCQRKADAVKESEYQRMDPWMMVGIGYGPQNLFQLVDAVRGHDPRKLIEIIGKPTGHTGKKGAQGRMIAYEIHHRRKKGGQH